MVIFFFKNCSIEDRSTHPIITSKKRLKNKLQLQYIFYSFNLKDIWRSLYPIACQYSYYSSVHSVHTRIDYLLWSTKLFSQCESVEISSHLITDHSWVGCQIGHMIRDNKGFNWTIQRSLLKDELSKSAISSEINNILISIWIAGYPLLLFEVCLRQWSRVIWYR